MKKILQYQVALFFAKKYEENFEKASLKIKEAFGESVDTRYIPLPPVESMGDFDIPGLILKYNGFAINLAKSRIDLLLQEEDKAIDRIKKFINTASQGLSVKIGRIGFVKTFFVDKNNDYLKTFLAQDKIQALDITNISLRINEKKKFGNFDFNNSQSFQVGTITESEKSQEGIITIRDINSFAEKVTEENFSKSDLVSLVEILNQEADKFLIE